MRHSRHGFGPRGAAAIRTLPIWVGSYELARSPDGYLVGIFYDGDKTRVRRCVKNWVTLFNASFGSRGMWCSFHRCALSCSKSD